MKSALYCMVALALSALPAFGAEMSFEGVLIKGDRPLFSLRSGDARSGWLPLGGSFEGYKLTKFDAHREVVTLEKDGAILAIALRKEKVTQGVAPDNDRPLRELKGLPLAYEVARRGDPEVVDLLTRYHEAMASLRADEPAPIHVEFLRHQLEKVATAKAAQLLKAAK